LNNSITGIILAGGVSKRLGYKNKALLKIGNKTIIERVIDALSKMTEDVIIITNSPSEFKHLKMPMYNDIISNAGPLGGIYTGLTISNTYYNLVIACDMPFIQSYILELLVCRIEDNDIVIPVTPDGYHPLCAIYSKKCIDYIKLLIDSGNLKVANLFNYMKVNKVDFPVYDECELNAFFNINTNEDYLRAISLAENYDFICLKNNS